MPVFDILGPLQHAAGALAWLPFLPRGRGALILMMGGLGMLPASLLWSRLASGTQWSSGIEPGAARLGLAACHVVWANSRSCVVEVARCASCRAGAAHGACDRERRCLLALAVARAPNATVVEVGCNVAGRGRCTFVVRRGRAV